MTEAERKGRGRRVDPAKDAAILLAAKQEFMARGIGATTMDRIAEAAGVSKATVYARYPDKRAAFVACIDAAVQQMQGHAIATLDDQTPLRDRLVTFGVQIVALICDPEVVAFERQIMAEAERFPEFAEAYLEHGPRQVKQALHQQLARAEADGALVIPDRELACEQLILMMKGDTTVHRPPVCGQSQAVDDRIRAAVDLFIRGYAPHWSARA